MRRSTIDKERAEIARLRPLARKGDVVAINNIACCYRVLGRHALAFTWWRRAVEAGDGDAHLEVAYCYQHGMGVRKNPESAITHYQSAMQSLYITPNGREESLYQLATLLLSIDEGSASREQARELLVEADADGDYPQAAELLDALRCKVITPCTCRRHLRPSLARRACKRHKYLVSPS